MSIQLTEQQLSAVEMMRRNRMGILVGGPGTGKTTTVKEILSWAQDQGMLVAQAAPTGKAAKRMTEATGYEAVTIHSLLGAYMDNGQFVFAANEDNPLFADFVILDELSMVTSELMADFLRAINPQKTKLLLVGDSGQLPSVGAGAVLRDLLASGTIPHVELTTIHRNSGDIVKACHQIAKGKAYTPSKILDPENGLNLRHVEAKNPDAILSAIKTIVTERMPDRGFDPVWDCQCISPVNSKGQLSCDSINAMLQDVLNPNPDKKADPKKVEFRAKDKVIQTKNTKIKLTDGESSYIVNGDIGEVRDFERGKSLAINFINPDRETLIPKGKNKLLLAYCLTCHRLQGSEAPVVVIPLHKSFGYFVNRSWIYTAISRAREICITVGEFSAVEQAIRRKEATNRKTMLREKLVDRFIEGI